MQRRNLIALGVLLVACVILGVWYFNDNIAGYIGDISAIGDTSKVTLAPETPPTVVAATDSLVGTWRLQPKGPDSSSDAEYLKQAIIFRADGTYTDLYDGTPESSGTWRIEQTSPRELTLVQIDDGTEYRNTIDVTSDDRQYIELTMPGRGTSFIYKREL